ncbi:hypothetical protein KSS87_007859 [Heliosperma pusillum]|nr:hypothetical protein KSS87_007859 [Heliosperma pusillum]
MVVMYTTMPVLMGRMMCSVGPLVPVRGRLVRLVEDGAYTKNWVILDILSNLLIVTVSFLFLGFSAAEKPNVPLRVLAGGYVVQCLIHVVLVWFEYRRVARRRRREIDLEAASAAVASAQGSVAYKCDSLNMMASFVWGIVGLYWVKSGGKLLKQNAPLLYRLTMAYQACDLIFEMFCLAGIVMCCLLPCMIRIRYTVAGQEGAPEADLNVLPKYRFHMSSNGEKPSVGAGVMVPMDTGNGDSAAECVLLPEDAWVRIKPNASDSLAFIIHPFLSQACIGLKLDQLVQCPNPPLMISLGYLGKITEGARTDFINNGNLNGTFSIQI